MKPCCKETRDKALDEAIAKVREYEKRAAMFAEMAGAANDIAERLESLKAPETLKETP